MQVRNSLFTIAAAAMLIAWPVAAQYADSGSAEAPSAPETATVASDTTPPPAKVARMSLLREIEIQYARPLDVRGLNTFEPPKEAGVPFTGFKLSWGAAFAQQFQSLKHGNTAAENIVNGVNQNELYNMGAGFNNATANVYLNAQLAPGIRVQLTTYLSSRHHPDAWVKDGFLLIDASPFDVALFENIMKYVTVKAGHFEINYGDTHFRRSDNGNTLYNPFVGNYIMDAFTTEIGGEVYFRARGFLAMASVTGGEIKGSVASPDDRKPSYIGKLGFDRQVNEDLRVRLTASGYTTSSSVSNTLYGGDRAGSRYYFVMENTLATESARFTSGLINPGFRDKVTAVQVNPFLKFRGLELFGVIEQAEGRAANETETRTWNQYAGDAVYRFLDDQLYVGARYNTVSGPLAVSTPDVSVNRLQIGGGWFLTPSVLLKGEYVNQKYNDFPVTDIRSGGKFNGFVMEGVIAF